VPSTSASASTEPVDDAIESFYVGVTDFYLPSGKTPPTPKTKPASREAAAAHAKAVQTKYKSMGSQGYHEVSRFNASVVPATYITMEKKTSNGSSGFVTCDLALLTAEGENVQSIESSDVAVGDCNPPHFSLMKSPRGYFFDIYGADKPVYVLRSPNYTGALLSNDPQCIGRLWDRDSGQVRPADLPDYPARGKRVGPDDTIVFPSRAFHFELDGWSFRDERATEENSDACVGSFLTPAVDVMGVDSPAPDFRSDTEGVVKMYEQLQQQARANAKIARAWASQPAPVVRKWLKARFNSTCALDLVQLAAQLYVYGRTLGATSEDAIAEADAVMKNNRLEGECGSTIGGVRKDRWPDVRAALLKWKSEPHREAPKDAGADGDVPAASVGSVRH
jgi:hypothetical protein